VHIGPIHVVRRVGVFVRGQRHLTPFRAIPYGNGYKAGSGMEGAAGSCPKNHQSLGDHDIQPPHGGDMKPKSFATTTLCLAAALSALALARSCGHRKADIEPFEARESVREAVKAVEGAVKTAIEADTKAVEARPRVAGAKRKAKAATADRAAATIVLESLPVYVQTEIGALTDLAAELETQVALEIARGDAWEETALAERDVTLAVKEEAQRRTVAARRRGIRLGVTVTGAVVLILILL